MSGEVTETRDDGTAALTDASDPLKPHLFLVLEADDLTSRGARYGLSEVDEVVIGRGDTRGADRTREGDRRILRLRVPGRSMSGTHARLVRVDAHWELVDEGSRNGTFLGGERIRRAVLRDGAIAEMGHSFFLLRYALPTSWKAHDDVDGDALDAVPFGLRTLHPLLSKRTEALLRVATSSVPVLLLGETGTGKELAARAIHDASRRTGAFVPVNCGALPATLVESLLFGHARGAFSGAVRDEIGLVRAAEGGTLFLDEIGDLALTSQAALLRVLQEQVVVPVGATSGVRSDARIVAATHRPLEALSRTGEFRSDLLGRLKGYTHPLAALRDRREDLALLIAELLQRLPAAPSTTRPATPTMTVAAARALLAYPWPLNTRELGQCLSSSLLLAAGSPIAIEHLPDEVRPFAEGAERPRDAFAPRAAPEAPAPAPHALPGRSPREARLEAELIAALREQRGNVAAVARVMETGPTQVHRWMKRLGIDPDDYRR